MSQRTRIVMTKSLSSLVALLFLSACAGPPVSKGYYKRLRIHSQNSVASRLTLLPKPKMTKNPAVEKQLAYFSGKNRAFILQSVERREKYLDIMSNKLLKYGIPLELLNVGLIESGFKPKVISSAGARGIWQFMKPTAKDYGLKVNWLSDERTDPELSSEAAAKHLRFLYNQFKDWELALAAYNAGDGTVRRALKRTGAKDFWTLVKRGGLRRQTIEYVPKFIAVTMILNDPYRYGLGQELAAIETSKRNIFF